MTRDEVRQAEDATGLRVVEDVPAHMGFRPVGDVEEFLGVPGDIMPGPDGTVLFRAAAADEEAADAIEDTVDTVDTVEDE